MKETVSSLINQSLEAGYAPDGVYSAHCAFYHNFVGTMYSTTWATGKIKGLRRAWWNAKAMAVVRDWFSKGEDYGVVFWVEVVDGKKDI